MISLVLTLALGSPKAHHCTKAPQRVLPPQTKEAMDAVSHITGLNLNDTFDEHRDLYTSRFSKACIQAIEEARAQGPLFSQTAFDLSVPIEQYQFKSGKVKNQFFHWTDDDSFLELFDPDDSLFSFFSSHKKTRRQVHDAMVADGTYRKMFMETMAMEHTDFENLYMGQSLYIAADPKSSDYAGDELLVLYLDPKARVLSADIPPGSEKKIVEDFPEILHHCGTRHWNGFYQLLPMILADSGIAIQEYYTSFIPAHYFKLRNPGAIIRTEVNP